MKRFRFASPLTPGLVGAARPDLAKIGKPMVRVHEHGAGAIIAARSASTNRKDQHNEIDCNGARDGSWVGLFASRLKLTRPCRALV
jgi:hypothetical protein